MIKHLLRSTCFARPQDNTSFGQNNPVLQILTPSFGLEQHPQLNFGGQDQDKALAMLFPAFTLYHSDSNNVVSTPFHFNPYGVPSGRAYVI